MAPRAYWKGYLELSPCPITVFPTASEREAISFPQINEYTGHRIKSPSTRAGASQAGCARTEGQLT
jgi:non-homologous end joining protein Ku